jgi:AraC-like DNA-binding protein
VGAQFAEPVIAVNLDLEVAIDRHFLQHQESMADPVKSRLTLGSVEPDVLERLDRAREFIDHSYDHPLNLNQISAKACFSRYHFLRLFRKAFQKTPHQYLVERRIEKAKELLSSEELRVTDVCFEVGFQSLGSFSSLFHKYVGQAPIIYREKARQTRASRRAVPGCFLVMHGLEPAA